MLDQRIVININEIQGLLSAIFTLLEIPLQCMGVLEYFKYSYDIIKNFIRLAIPTNSL